MPSPHRWLRGLLPVVFVLIIACSDDDDATNEARERLTALTPEAATLSLPVGVEATLIVQGTFADGSTANLTSSLAFRSSDPTVVVVEEALGREGHVRGLAVGGATIAAEDPKTGITTSIAVAVTDATLVGVRVLPEVATLPLGTSVDYSVIADYSDASAIDVTTQATLVSSAPAVAEFATVPPNRLLAVAPGTASVTVNFGGTSQAVDVAVIGATLDRILIQSPVARLDVGESTRLRAIAVFSDGSEADVSESGVWSSADPVVFPVSNTAGQRGAVSVPSYVNGASAEITARWQNLVGAARVRMGCPNDDLTGFAGGAGTVDAPYLLCNREHIATLASDSANWAAGIYYRFIDDIDMESSGVVMGSVSSSFYANLDGDGHLLQNLVIDRTDLQLDVGFVGFLRDPGVVRELHVRNGSVRGLNQVGGLLGMTFGGLVEDCSFEGAVTATEGSAGGISGATWTSTIRRVAVRGSVTALGSGAGGIVADVGAGTTIRDVYSRAAVSAGGGNAGGIIGFYRGDAPTRFAYASGPVMSPGAKGGLVGNAPASAATFEGLFWDATGTTLATSAGTGTVLATALTPTQMTQITSFVDWDFATVWTIATGDLAPSLLGQPGFD